MRSYQISKGYQIPKAGVKGRFIEGYRDTTPKKMPLERMEVGDSFVIPATSREDVDNIQASVSSKLINYVKTKKAIAAGFTTRRVKSGVRVWRTA